MAVRIEHLIDVTLNDVTASQAATFDFQGVSPLRVSLYVQIVKANAPTNVTLTVELSPDDGATLITYDKLLTQDGTDSPQASEVYTTTEDDVLSLSLEDVVDYIRVNVAGTGLSSSATFAVDVWLVYSY